MILIDHNFFSDPEKYSTENEQNCLRFFALQGVSREAMKMTIDTLFQNFNTMWTSFKAYCKKEKKTGSMSRLLHPFLFFSNLHSFESFNKGLSYFTNSNYSYTCTCHDHKISLLIDPDIVVR